jgi:AcrR family transcriptional regulator
MTSDALLPRKRPSQQRSRETVNRILDTAARIFEAEGYANTTTNDIAIEAVISIGSLYQYYPNKDAIIVGLAERHIETITAQFVFAIERFRAQPAPSIEATVRALVTASADLTGSSELHSLLLTGCPRTRELDELLKRFDREVALNLASLFGDLGIATSNIKLLARLVFVVADSALHQVILPMKTKKQRLEAINELTNLLTNGLST